MTTTEINQLDQLIEISEEEDSPLSSWEKEFVQSLDGRRGSELSHRQLDVFDRLVSKHLEDRE